MTEDRCICCGEVIPEGMMVCPNCQVSQKKKPELKPCPFCGGEAKTSQGTTDPENKFQFGWIGCQKCRCFINYVNNNRGLKEATAAWNRRVPQTVVNQHGSNCTHISNCGTLNLNL